MSKKLLKWGEMPFSVPRTEKIEGEQFPCEGLHEGIVYLTPVEDKKSKNGNAAYGKDQFMLEFKQAYIKDNRIVFQPSNASQFHGTAFCFNRPQSEKDDSGQQRLLGEWAKNYCVCILDCSSHKQLKFLTDNLDGKFLQKDSKLTVITNPSEVSTNVADKFNQWKKLVEGGEDFENALDDIDGADELEDNYLVVPFVDEETNLRTKDWKAIYSEEALKENAPVGFPDLTNYAKIAPPASSNGGKGGKGGYNYNPAQKYDFIISTLKQAGIEGGNAKDIVSNALDDELNWLTLNFVLSANGCQPLNISYDFSEQNDVAKLQENIEDEEQPDYTAVEQDTYRANLQKLIDDDYPEVYLSKFDWTLVDEEKAQLIYEIINALALDDTETRNSIKKVTQKRLSNKFTLSHMTIDELKSIKEQLIA